MLFIALDSFEAFDAMVECCICRIEIKVLELFNYRFLPSTVGTVVVADQHVVGEKGPEGILMVGTWLGLLFNVFFNGDVLGVECILRFNISRILHEPVTAKRRGITAVD